MGNKIGPPVEGDNFFGRDKELAYIIKKLNDGNHILLTAPRRVGKTSFALRILQKLREKNWEGIFVDIEGAQDELMAIKQIVKAIKRNTSLWKKVGSSIKELLKGLKLELGGTLGKIKIGSTAEQADNLMEQLGEILINIDHPFLIVIDELPVFLLELQKKEDGEVRVRNFLNRLRAYRISSYGKNTPKRFISWFFCGSIGLENYTSIHNLSSTINDLMPYEIGAYTPEEALAFIQLLCQQESLHLESAISQYLIEKAGWPIPFYLRIIFEEIEKLRIDAPPVTKKQVDLAYHNAIKQAKIALDNWIQRLKDQLAAEQHKMARQLLNQIAQSGSRNFNQIKGLFFQANSDNLQLDDKLFSILDLLVNEGYLIKKKKNYSFRSPFIRDWWKLKNHL